MILLKDLIGESNPDIQYVSVEDFLEKAMKFSGRDLVLFDLETTGIDSRKDQITQIAAAIVDGETFEIKNTFNEKVGLSMKHLDALFSKQSSDMRDRSKREKSQKNKPGLLGLLIMTNYFGLNKSEIGQLRMSNDRGQWLKKRYEESSEKTPEKYALKKFLSSAKNPILVAHNSDFDTKFIKNKLDRYSSTISIPKETEHLLGWNESDYEEELSRVPGPHRKSKSFRILLSLIAKRSKELSGGDKEKNKEEFTKLVNYIPNKEMKTLKSKFDSFDVFDTLDLIKYYFIPAIRTMIHISDENVSKKAKQILYKLTRRSSRNYKHKKVYSWSATASLGPQSSALNIDSTGWHDAFSDIMMMMEVMRFAKNYIENHKDYLDKSEEFKTIKNKMKNKSEQHAGEYARFEDPK